MKNYSTNKEILNYVESRLDLGNIRFGGEMPINGKYNEEDALEELIDGLIYLSNKALYIKKQKKCSNLAQK
ncbi:MAG: hypothetical protein Unbinned400contig1004_44 [Prokaryotic dsDNA virus sp.]|nr:MAG: hypothetical protein Unbinned400contig1004_44 [Prokaryotic dsDNA virus sp.]|tara:strand:+ start:245 stop:457 length:213 start_codon:yes stop_codon:yes gene_type:complete